MKVQSYNEMIASVAGLLSCANRSGTVQAIAAILGIWILSSCNTSALQGNDKSSTGKKDEASGTSEDETAVPPEVLAGSYLTCGPVEPTSEDLEAGEASADNDIIGCAILSTATDQAISVEDYSTTWIILDTDGKPVSMRQAKLKKGARLGFAAVVEKGTGSKQLVVDVKFPKSASNKGAKRSDYSRQECKFPAFCAKGEVHAPPGGACAVETATLKTTRGGCTHLPSGIVIGGLNFDPTNSGSSGEGVKTMKYDEAATICESYEAGGYSDWRLPTKEEFNILQGADLENKIHFLKGADGQVMLTHNTPMGFWTGTSASDGKRVTCSIFNKNCAEQPESDEQFNFCIRLSK